MVLLLSVFLTAFIFSMFGLGGGLFYMPIFMFFCKSPQEASLLSFLCIFVTAGSSALRYYRAKSVDGRLVIFLGIPLSVMIFVSGFVVSRLAAPYLKLILGSVLCFAGILLAQPRPRWVWSGGIYRFLRQYFPHRDFTFHPAVLSPLAGLAGFSCGLAGIAGGVFEIPMMAGLLRVSAPVAVGTSSVAVLLSGFLGAVSRISFLSVPFSMNVWLVGGILLCAFLGAQLGPQVSLNINRDVFKRVCGFVIFVIGLYYAVHILL